MRILICFLLSIVALSSIIISVWNLVISKYAIALTFGLLWIVSLGCLMGVIWEVNKNRKMY